MNAVDRLVDTMVNIHKMGMMIGLQRTAVKMSNVNGGDQIVFLSLKRIEHKTNALEADLDKLIAETHTDLQKLSATERSYIRDRAQREIDNMLNSV
jgi:hypothetical protein